MAEAPFTERVKRLQKSDRTENGNKFNGRKSLRYDEELYRNTKQNKTNQECRAGRQGDQEYWKDDVLTVPGY